MTGNYSWTKAAQGSFLLVYISVFSHLLPGLKTRQHLCFCVFNRVSSHQLSCAWSVFLRYQLKVWMLQPFELPLLPKSTGSLQLCPFTTQQRCQWQKCYSAELEEVSRSFSNTPNSSTNPVMCTVPSRWLSNPCQQAMPSTQRAPWTPSGWICIFPSDCTPALQIPLHKLIQISQVRDIHVWGAEEE